MPLCEEMGPGKVSSFPSRSSSVPSLFGPSRIGSESELKRERGLWRGRGRAWAGLRLALVFDSDAATVFAGLGPGLRSSTVRF